ncbi:tetratricopeptide repeat protein [Plebeiibacterium sediminum]|uniref:Tetratricopeptide repeat protein n=1 Tax=Plebeiibacterium sediminum TaxID=2992112 RepID=A0AAE3M7J6_9BACT|nr:tetratricopeptide repeat protein [Plebeiobacterium sediminum]MCW3788558.1 hypothetical protein [Plebeiobacterium sediminum]
MKSFILCLILITSISAITHSQVSLNSFDDTMAESSSQSKIKLAKNLVYNFKLDSAIIVYQNIFAEDSSNIEIIQELETLYFKTSNYDSALIYIDKMLSIEPDNQHYCIKKGIILSKMKEYAKALEIFKSVLKSDINNQYIITQIADIYRNINNVDSAYFYYTSACELKPNISTLIKASDVLLKNKWNKETMHFIEKYNSSGMLKSKVLQRLYGKALYLNDSVYHSYEVFNELHKNGDSSQVTNKFLGLSCWKIKHYIKGEELLKQYIKKDTTDYLAYYVLGRCCLHNNKAEESIEYITKSFNLYQPNPETISMMYKALAESYEWMQDYNKALEFYNLIAESDPKNIYGDYKVAMIYDYDLKNQRKAIQCYNELIDKIHASDPANNNKIEIYCKRRIKELEESVFWNE